MEYILEGKNCEFFFHNFSFNELLLKIFKFVNNTNDINKVCNFFLIL